MTRRLSLRSVRAVVPPALLGALALAVALPACAAESAPAAAPKTASKSAPAAASKPASGAKGDVVAEVGGKPITMAELEEALAPQLANLERQKRKIIEDGVADVVNDRLVETEAAARGMTVQKLLEAEIDKKVTPVTDAEAQAFYDSNKARMNQPFEQLKERILTFLAGQQRGELQKAMLDSLSAKYNPRILLEPMRAEIKTAGSPAKGPENAPVTIVEFSDFQCPYCSRVIPAIDEAVKVYGDQVRVVFRQFPLSMHKDAQKAAEASLCANEQGKFWGLHDAMFANQQALGVEQLKGKAAELGVDAKKFNACLDGGKYAQQVATDLAEGSQAGVSGTPAMFINGRFVSGAVPFDQLASIIDDELVRKGIKPNKKAS
jgi:protein-disulfide isomerase